MSTSIAGVDHKVAPVMTQEAIDLAEPQRAGRQRYRLTGPGSLAIGKATVTGPQMAGAVASQLVWLSAAAAADFGDLVELAS